MAAKKKRMARTTSAAVTEPSAFVEIGGYAHMDGGQVKTKLYVSDVNEPLKIDDSEATKRLKKIRVSMNVEEDKSVTNNCVYEKKVEMVQDVVDGASNPSGPMASSTPYSTGGDTAPDGSGPSALQVLKNFVDNIANDTRLQWIALVGLGVLAATALVVALLR